VRGASGAVHGGHPAPRDAGAVSRVRRGAANGRVRPRVRAALPGGDAALPAARAAVWRAAAHLAALPEPLPRRDGGRDRRAGRFFLDVPDEVERPAVSESVRIVDLIDGLAEFARAFPGWLGDDGYPLSWRHY